MNTKTKVLTQSEGERAFRELWIELTANDPGLSLIQEYVFYPGRKWRSDFAHISSMVLIEIEGGSWARGRHNIGRNSTDLEKYFVATLAGWTLFRLSPAMITRENLESIIRFIRKKNK